MTIWRPIEEFPAYEVSDQGQVRSIKSQRLVSQHPKGKHQYLYVSLSKDGTVRQRPVHYVVLETFHREKREGESARHKNFNYQDNRAANLEWGTTLTSPRYQVPTAQTDSNTLRIELYEGDQLYRARDDKYFFVERTADGVLALVEDKQLEE